MKIISNLVSLIIFFALLGVGLYATYHYVLAPRVLLKDIRSALVRKDPQSLERMIDFAKVKSSLTQSFQEQMVAEIDKNPMAELDLWAGEEMMYSVLDKVITPEGLIELTDRPNGDLLHVSLPPNYSIKGWVKSTHIRYNSWKNLTMTTQTSDTRSLDFELEQRSGHWTIVGMRLPQAMNSTETKK